MEIDFFAVWIGRIVMVAGGLLLAILSLWFAAERVWRFWINGMNTTDIMEATAEWRKTHPERFKRWKKRNKIEQEDAL